MIAPNGIEIPRSKKGKILYYGIILSVTATIVILLIPPILESLNPTDFWAIGSNTEVQGAPNGVYLQKEWGSFDNTTNTWTFAMCDHDYLGALHGTWHVKENIWIPSFDQGVYPIDARLYLTIENNIIVKAEVKSQLEYGN